MSKKLIKTTRVGKCSVKIYRDSEYGEYNVKSIMAHGKPGPGDGYFTDNKKDARDTAAHSVRWLKKRRSCKETV